MQNKINSFLKKIKKYASEMSELQNEEFDTDINLDKLIDALDVLNDMVNQISTSQDFLDESKNNQELASMMNMFKEAINKCIESSSESYIDAKLVEFEDMWESVSSKFEKSRQEFNNKAKARLKADNFSEAMTKIEDSLRKKFEKSQKDLYNFDQESTLRNVEKSKTELENEQKAKKEVKSLITDEFIEKKFQEYKNSKEYKLDKAELEQELIDRVVKQDYVLSEEADRLNELLFNIYNETLNKSGERLKSIIEEYCKMFNILTISAINLDKADFDNDTSIFAVEDENLDISEFQYDEDDSESELIEEHISEQDSEMTQFLQLVKSVSSGSYLFNTLCKSIENKVQIKAYKVMMELKKSANKEPSDVITSILSKETGYEPSNDTTASNVNTERGVNWLDLKHYFKEYFDKIRLERQKVKDLLGEKYEETLQKAKDKLTEDIPLSKLSIGLTTMDKYILTRLRKIKTSKTYHTKTRQTYLHLHRKNNSVIRAVKRYNELLLSNPEQAQKYYEAYLRTPKKMSDKNFSKTPFYVTLDKMFRINPSQAIKMVSQEIEKSREYFEKNRINRTRNFFPVEEKLKTDQLILNPIQIKLLESATSRSKPIPMDESLARAINIWKSNVQKIWGKPFEAIKSAEIKKVYESSNPKDTEKKDSLLLDLGLGIPGDGSILISEEQIREISTGNKDKLRIIFNDLFTDYKIEYLSGYDPDAKKYIESLIKDSPSMFKSIFGEDPTNTNLTKLKKQSEIIQAEGIGEFYAKLMAGDDKLLFRLLNTLNQNRPDIMKELLSAQDLQSAAPKKLLQVVKDSSLLGKEDLVFNLNNLYVTKSLVKFLNKFKEAKQNTSILEKKLLSRDINDPDVVKFMDSLNSEQQKAYLKMDQQKLSGLFHSEKYKPLTFMETYRAPTFDRSFESQRKLLNNPIKNVTLPLSDEPIFAPKKQEDVNKDPFDFDSSDDINKKASKFIKLINKYF